MTGKVLQMKVTIEPVPFSWQLDKDYLAYINKSAVEITGEPFACNSNLDFLVDEYRHSRKSKADYCVMVFRIISTHPFVQGNKRTAFALMSKYGLKDAKEAEGVLGEIAKKPGMPTVEGVQMLEKVLNRKFRIHARIRKD